MVRTKHNLRLSLKKTIYTVLILKGINKILNKDKTSAIIYIINYNSGINIVAHIDSTKLMILTV